MASRDLNKLASVLYVVALSLCLLYVVRFVWRLLLLLAGTYSA